MNSVFIILITFVLVTDNTAFTNPYSFGSSPATHNYETITFQSHEDCQDGLMRIFTNTPPEKNPSIEKHDEDKIRIMVLDGEYRRKFTCKEIML